MVLEERDKGCVLFLPFEENSGNATLDFSGNDNSGTIYGANWVDGKFGKALSFDGVDDYVQVSHNPSLSITDAITIEAWIKPSSLTPVYQEILSKGGDYNSNNNNYDIYLHYTRVAIHWKNDVYESLTGILINTWTHIAITIDVPNLISKMYINGNLDKTFTITTVPEANTNPLVIGKYIIGSPYPFNGLIDEVRIYNRALSEEEIKSHFLAGVRKFYPIRFAHLRTFPGCVLNLPMEERSGTTVYDQSGFKNHGTIYGATWSYGKIGRGLSFDGVDDYVSVPNSPSLNITNAITIEAWVLLKEKTLDWRTVIAKSPDITLSSLTFAFDMRNEKDGNFTFNINIGGWKQIETSLPLNEWHHMAMTYDGSTFKAFKDGVIVGSISVSGSIYSNTAPVEIGRIAGDDYWNGFIDEVRIYNRALTPKEILAHYFEGLKTHQMNPIITRQVA